MIESNNNSDGTKPSKAVSKSKTTPRRGRTILIYALILIVVLGISVFSGYQSGIGIRRDTRAEAMSEQVGEQFQSTLVDIEFGRYEVAKQRLEWIIDNDPSFPGAQEKLTEVLVQINLQENYVPPTSTPSLTSTPDFSGVQEAFARAQQLIAAQDWPGALSALDQSRKLDPSYQTSQVDGMYYFALRNNGYDLITQQGNLEGGIYYITLAERFGILDANANGVREGARYYILGASFWELNWEQTLFYFNQVYSGWPGLWDGTMTASDRYRIASMRYGDEFFGKDQFCDAVVQYENAMRLGQLDQLAQQNYDQAFITCFPATPTFDPASLFTPTIDPSLPTNTPDPGVTNTPVPTDTPVPTPTTPPP
jgi:tetratricopeptide (TPR) repeat protein